MPIYGTDFDAIVRAVQAIHDVNTPNEQRIYYTQELENLKERTLDSVAAAFYLIEQQQQPVRHIGWNIIEHIIRYKWVEIDANLRVRIRNEVLEQISKGQYSIGNADSLIKTSIARTVVYMMENEWPQNWPELFSQFRQIVNNTKLFLQSQMIFIVLKRLVEDVVTLVTIEDVAKRKDLSVALSAHMPDILEMSISKLQFCLLNEITENSIYLAKTIIEFLSEVVEWVTNTILHKVIVPIIDVLCAYLGVEMLGIFEEAAKCLWRLASRKSVKAQEMPIVASMFRDNSMHAILTSANFAADKCSSSIQHYNYLKTLCDLLCALGVHLTDVWGYLPSPPTSFNVYLSAISAFFIHPSIYIRAETSQVLAAFSAHDKISKDSNFINCITSSFQHLPRCMERSGIITLQCGDNNNNLTTHFSQIDYSDDDDLLRDFLVLRERCCKIIRENTVARFDQLFAIVNSWIINRFVVVPEVVEQDEFDMMKRFINTLLTSANQFKMMTLEISKIITSLYDTVFSRIATINNPKTLNGTLSILSAFLQALDDCPDRVLSTLERFKVLLMIENINNEDLDTLSLKRHCIVLMLKMISLYPDAVKPHAQILLNIVVEVAERVTVMQRATLVHVLAALSNLIGSVSEQQLFLQNASQNTLMYLKSDEYLSGIASGQHFFEYIGLMSQAPASEEETLRNVCYDNRLTLRSHLTAIEGILQYVNLASSVVYPLLYDVIPSFFQLAKTLNSIYCSENIALIHSSYGSKVLDLTTAERRIIYFSMLETELKEQTSTNNLNDPITYTRRYIVELTELLENVLGLLGSKLTEEFYGNSSTSDLLCFTLYYVESVPDCRKRFWIRRAWNKLVCCCPSDKSHVVVNLTVQLTQYMHTLITDRCNIIQNRNAEEEPTEEELFVESVTSIMCREYAAFLKSLVMGEMPLHKGTKKDSGELLDPLARELFKNKDLLNNVIVSMLKLINCPDTQAAVKVIPVASIVVGNYYHKMDEQMAHSIFISTIQSLQIHGSDEVISGPLLNLIFNIYSLLRPIHPSLVDILAQVPQTVPDTIRTFDNRVMCMVSNKEKFVDKNKRDLMRKILKPVIATTIGEQYKRPVLLRRVN